VCIPISLLMYHGNIKKWQKKKENFKQTFRFLHHHKIISLKI
jgi:hypothetical protein